MIEKTEKEHPVRNLQIEDMKEYDRINKILGKFVNKSKNATKGSAVEFSKGAFNLSKMDSHGHRESLDGKMCMNFWTFDISSNHQLDLIPTYMDMSEWLNVCHIILTDRINRLTEEARKKQAQGNYRYCNPIYQNMGGSYKSIYKVNGSSYGGMNLEPVSCIFKIIPSIKEGSWVLSSEIYEGTAGETGLIEPKKGSQPVSKVQVLFSYDDLVKVAMMSILAIQSNLMRI